MLHAISCSMAHDDGAGRAANESDRRTYTSQNSARSQRRQIQPSLTRNRYVFGPLRNRGQKNYFVKMAEIHKGGIIMASRPLSTRTFLSGCVTCELWEGGALPADDTSRPTTRESDSHVLPPQRTAAAGSAASAQMQPSRAAGRGRGAAHPPTQHRKSCVARETQSFNLSSRGISSKNR